MNAAEPLGCPWIIGPGRLGLALAAALGRCAGVGRVHVGGRSGQVPPDSIFTSREVSYFRLEEKPSAPAPSVVLITVPDAAISGVAEALSAMRLDPVPVLHTSGSRGRDVLKPLAARGHPTGSLHPLVAVPADEEGRRGFAGAWFGIAGTEAAVLFADRIVQAIGGRSFVIDDEAKPMYHAASVAASNYVVALLAVAERWMRDSGVPEPTARAALTTLATGAVQNVARSSPPLALTGPISRGDVQTVELHLGRLSGKDRELYSVLAAEALALARAQGLSSEVAEELAQVIERT